MIKADHENFFRLYDEFQASGVAEHRQHLAWQLIRDLTVHSIGEEEVLYPAMSEHMGTEVRQTLLCTACPQYVCSTAWNGFGMACMDIATMAADEYCISSNIL